MYIVMELLKHSEQDDYEDGCLLDTSKTSTVQVHFKNDTLQGLLDDLQNFTGFDDIQLNACGESGRVDLQGRETADGYPATYPDIAEWELGRMTLYATTYTAIVYKAEISKLVEGF